MKVNTMRSSIKYNLSICNIQKQFQLSKFQLKNFTIKYPERAVRINKQTQEIAEEIKTKKPEEMKYNSKHDINVENLDDYYIIGAEIFKSSFKDAAEKNNKGDITHSHKFLEEAARQEQEIEVYGAKVSELKWQEPSKYYKHFTRRTFYDMAEESKRHLFVPSYRYKVEPFNSIHTFRWDAINGNLKDHNETIFKRNNFVKGFIPPFELNNNQVEQIFKELQSIKETHKIEFNSSEFHKIITDIYNSPYESNKEGVKSYMNSIDSFLDLIPNLNHKIFPAFIMKSYFELSLNDKRLWIAMEQEILNNLHHYTNIELCQINYIANLNCPKYTSLHFRQLLKDTIYKQLESNTLSMDELFTISFAFRNQKNFNFYDKVSENFVKRKEEFFKTKDTTSQIPSNLSKMFYSWASHKPKQFNHSNYYIQKENIEKFVETFEDDLNESIPKMSQEDIFRLSTSLYLLRTENVDPFINRIERNLLKIKNSNPESVDPFALHGVLRSFSKMKAGKMSGSDKFYDEMEQIVLYHLENYKYSFQQFSDILYAYSVRASGSEKLYKVFDKKLNEDIEKANNYHTLHNIVWHLLFTENKNVDLWRNLMQRYNSLEGRLPIYYYRPFKIAAFFMENAFTESELDKLNRQELFDFKDRFYDPEQIYDYVKYEKTQFKNQEYGNFKGMLNGRLMIFPLAHATYENMFIVHNCWEHQKMGINLWIDRDKIPKTNPVRINRQCYLHSKMLKLQGWEILDVIWEDFLNLGNQAVRDKFLHDWYYSTYEKQASKGIAKMDPKFV
jgi:hypothetical protein